MKVLGLSIAIVATSLICGSRLTAATLHVDRFDTDAQGWGGGGGLPFQQPTGGAVDGGGFLRVPTGTNLATFNSADRWVGNLTTIGAARIRVDLMAPTTSAPLPIRVVLFGPANLQQRWTSVVAQTVPNDGVWRNYTFPLGSGDLVATQIDVPPVTYAQIMASTLQIMLRYDPGDPSHGGEFVDGELDVDNVALASAPIAGDFNDDGAVNGADLSQAALGWKSRFGADLDGHDFLTWQRNLGNPSAIAATAAAPEPSTLALALGSATLTASFRRKKRRAIAAPPLLLPSSAPFWPLKSRNFLVEIGPALQ